MNRTALLLLVCAAAALTACQKNDPATPAVVIQSQPGPAGPSGATGATGMTGTDGSKGEPGKPGNGTVVIVTPPAAASAPAN